MDFVFNDSYELKTLNELEIFIMANNQLPAVDPAKVMEKIGLELGRMDIKLLRKIEEPTLYFMEQNKKIESLEIKISELTIEK